MATLFAQLLAFYNKKFRLIAKQISKIGKLTFP